MVADKTAAASISCVQRGGEALRQAVERAVAHGDDNVIVAAPQFNFFEDFVGCHLYARCRRCLPPIRR